MPLIVNSHFMTQHRRTTEPQMLTAINDLVPPPDETVVVDIGDLRTDADIHVTIRRRRKTLLWSDGWTVNVSDDPNTYKYEKSFQSNTSVAEIAASPR